MADEDAAAIVQSTLDRMGDAVAAELGVGMMVVDVADVIILLSYITVMERFIVKMDQEKNEPLERRDKE